MSARHTPPKWLGVFTLLCGLFVLAYLSFTEKSISDWIFPTGIVAIIMAVIGVRWVLTK